MTKKPLSIWVLSDLHLNPRAPLQLKKPANADVLVLAGDIGTSTIGPKWARSQFPDLDIVYVAGNHEYYGGTWPNDNDLIQETCQKLRIHFLEKEAVTIQEVEFLGATLWTNYALYGASQARACMRVASRCMNDHRCIENGKTSGLFSPDDALEDHQASLAWLTDRLSRPTTHARVVVTHHLPFEASVHPKYKDNFLSAAFASRLDHLAGKAECWIHGHTHESADYVFNGTRVVCNPRGYTMRDGSLENRRFEAGKVVQVPRASVL